jgi:hypothetical protein
MLERTTLVLRTLAAAVVLSALAFGAQEAVATGIRSECDWDPPYALGTCTTPQKCAEDCVTWGTPGGGFCNWANCCLCEY